MTTLLDKDVPVGQTLATLKEIFAQIQLSPAVVNEYNPLFSCWSHHIILDDCVQLSTNGKGATKDASLASGFAELIERFLTGALFSEYALCRKRHSFYFHPDERPIFIKKPQQFIAQQKGISLLTPELLQYYDPDNELLASHLMDSNYSDDGRGIIALPFTPLTEKRGCGGKVWFPVALLDNLYATNGMAAGNSRWECMNQALGEIFERHVKYSVIAEGIALPDFPDQILRQYPDIMRQYSALKDAGYSLWLKDASLGGQFPVVCVLLLDPTGGVFASFGCSCYLGVALGRAVTEMFQGRELSRLQGFSRPETMMAAFADSSNLEQHFINSEGLLPLRLFRNQGDIPFASDFWNALGKNRGTGSAGEYRYLCQLIEQAGYYGYRMEYNCNGFFACRIVIPGMSEIYPPDELIWNNRNRGSWLRTMLLKLPGLKEKKLSQLIDRLERAEFSAEELVSSLIGVVFVGKSVWGELRIGELKALLYLALFSRQKDAGEKALQSAENARIWCRWVREYSGLSSCRIRIYILLEQLLAVMAEGDSLEEYKSFFSASFSLEELTLAEDIISGKRRFWGLVFGESWEEVSPEYKNIMNIFSKYQKVLASFATPHSCN